MSIPFIDLNAQFQELEDEIRSAVDRVLAHGKFIMGPEVAELERELEKFVRVRNAVACSSGTDALLMALMAHNIGPGDLVFTTPFTFVATGEVISLLGATPVFVDIDPRTFNIDCAGLERAIEHAKQRGTGKPKGIVTVDLFGLPCDYDAITPLAEQYGLFLLEDAAQSFGAEYHGKRACGFGHVGATSFFPAKPLGCYGDGGAVFTDNDDLADRLRSIRIHGQGRDKYDNIRTGLNARLDTLQAAILLPKLAAFPHELQARQRIAERYSDLLTGHVETPYVPDHSRSAWAQYSVLSDRRALIQQRLKDQGIPTAVYYAKPLHLQSAYAHLGYRLGDFPNAEAISQRIFSLPMHPYLNNEQIDVITSAVVASAQR